MTFYVIMADAYDWETKKTTRKPFRKQKMSVDTAVLYVTEQSARRAVDSRSYMGKNPKIVAVEVSEGDERG